MESVGRNDVFQINLFCLQKSLSAWRAWVEIYAIIQKFVAESSLSAWRAWVEMLGIWCQGRHLNVALRMESVGRNNLAGSSMPLKYMSLSAWRAWVEIKWLDRPIHTRRSLSAWRAWVEIFRIQPTLDLF